MCPHCGATVPDGTYCGACGADFTRESPRRSRRRTDSYAAFPDEPILRASAISSLFPRLTSRSRPAFRAMFMLVAVVLLGLALARLDAAVTAVSALAVPLLFVCYVVEVDPRTLRYFIPTVGVLLGGAALGCAFALGLGRTVSDGLVPTLGSSLVSSTVLRSAVLAPVIAQLLMIVPVAVLRMQRPAGASTLEGFTAGALGALGFGVAVTFVELSSGVLSGNVFHGSIMTMLAEALLRGLSAPLVGAALTGYIGAALWCRTEGRMGAGAHWVTSLFVALGVALVLQVGLGFADVAGLTDASLIVVHLAAALVAIVALRIGLHHLLINDRHDVRVGSPRLCPHCYHIVPAMPFCPNCGIAEKATAPLSVPIYGRPPRSDGRDAAKRASSIERAKAPPTSAAASRDSSFPLASIAQARSPRHLGYRHLSVALVAGLSVIAALFVALAAALPSGAAAPCVSLRCFSPFGPVPIQRGRVYSSSDGWGLTWYPPRAALPGAAPNVTMSSSRDELHLSFSSATTPAEDGDLFFVGEPANGQNAAQLVNGLQQSNAPNATLDYVLFNATVGYHLGYGASFQTTPNSSDGYGLTYEVVITCAVVNGYGVCAYGVGPRVNVSAVVNHPTPSKLALSLWSDPDLNSVVWRSTSRRADSAASLGASHETK